MNIETNIKITCTDTTEAQLLLGCLLVAQDALSNQTNNHWRTIFKNAGMAFGGNHAGWLKDHICALQRALALEGASDL